MRQAAHAILARILFAIALSTSCVSYAADFSGKTIEWIVPASPGGGTDLWARFYAPLLSEKLPGKPAIVIKNIPGASNTTGTNFFQARAKPDGLMILATAMSTLTPYLLDDQRVKYDYRDWQIVLASPTGVVAYVQPNIGVKSARDIKKLTGRELPYASQGATSADLLFLLGAEVMGLKLKTVFGFSGRGPTRLAFERGEVLIDNQTADAYRVNVIPLVQAGKAVPLFAYGVVNAKGELIRDPNFPELPSFAEAYEMAFGKKIAGPQFQTWKALVGGFGTMLMLRKGTPKDIADTYVRALEEVVKMPDFPGRARGVLGPYNQMVGNDAAAHLNRVLSVDKQAKAWLKNWLKEKYNVKF